MGSYTPVSTGSVFLSSDGGTSWIFTFTCVSGNTDSQILGGAAFHSASVISVWGRSVICYSRDSGTTWATVPIYRPGSSNSYALDNGDAGNMHLMRTLTNSDTTISFVCTPPKLASLSSLIVYKGTLTLSTGVASLTNPVTIADGVNSFSSYTMYLIFPPSNPSQSSLGFILSSTELWVTINGGTSWASSSTGLSSPSSATQPACPQALSGYCYTTVSHTTIYRASTPFTTWTALTVTLPTVPTGLTAWTFGTGYRAMECARVSGADWCFIALNSIYITASIGTVEQRLLYTQNGWTSSQNMNVAITLGSARAWATFPSLRDTGPSTVPTSIIFGGGRGTLMNFMLDSTQAITRLHPPAPRTGGLALAFFGDGSCLLVGNDRFSACSSNGALQFSAASSGWMIGDATISATYTVPANTAGTAAAILSQTTWLIAFSSFSNGILIGSTLWLTTSSGASFTQVCTVYTPAGNTLGLNTPSTRQIKLVYSRASSSDAVKTSVYIVHPFIIYKYDGTSTGSSCGSTIATFPPPSIDTADYSAPVGVPMAIAIGCSPDSSRGCFVLKATMQMSDPSIYDFRDFQYITSLALYADCGTEGAFSGTAIATANLAYATSQYSNVFFGFTSDIIFGSASAGLAYTGVPGGFFITADGKTWSTCRLDVTGCIDTVVDQSGGSGQSFISSAAFVSSSVAYAYVSDASYVVSSGPAKLLRFTFTYSSGVGSVVGTVLDIGAGSGNDALFLPANGYLVVANLMATQPRFFPVTDSSGATGCTPLPNGYVPPVAISPFTPSTT